MRFGTSALAVQAAEQGLGIALETTSIVLPSLMAGHLAPIFPEMKTIAYDGYWLVCPKRHLQRRPVALFRDWLLDQGRRHDTAVTAYLSSY